MKKNLRIVLMVVVLLVTSLACQMSIPGSTVLPTLPAVQIIEPLPAVSQPPALDVVGSQELLVSLYATVSPGVVSIMIATPDGTGLGSGFVLDTEGHIVTNYHVVEGSDTAEVDFTSGLKVYGQVIGTDLDSDLAVIKVDVPADQLHPVPLGDPEQLKVGQTVVAIGNPFGLTSTMTVGIISALGRTLESLRQSSGGNYFTAGDLIQTDAAINPGNSGGPLLNLNGEVVGLNRAIRTTGTTTTGEPVNSGIGFAISVSIIRRVVPFLISEGKYDYPYLGVSSLPELDLATQELLGLSQSTGAYVTLVVEGGPADQAGIRGGTQITEVEGILAGGDLIIAADGRTINVFSELLSYMLLNKKPGDQIQLTILRNGEQKEVTVTLDKRP